MRKSRGENIPKTLKMCLNNKYVQLALKTVVFVDRNLFIVTTMKHATHNIIWNTLQLSNSKHFPYISWKMPILGAPRAHCT